jgi:predicted nucleotidyltransferase
MTKEKPAYRHAVAASIERFIPKDRLVEFCRKHHIRKLSLFGSALRGQLHPNSDIDLLVEFETGHVPGLITLAGMEIELTEMIGRKADLRTPRDLSRYFRDQVVNAAEVQYEAR